MHSDRHWVQTLATGVERTLNRRHFGLSLRASHRRRVMPPSTVESSCTNAKCPDDCRELQTTCVLQGLSDKALSQVLEGAVTTFCAKGKPVNHRQVGMGTWIIVAAGTLCVRRRNRQESTETTISLGDHFWAEACVRMASALFSLCFGAWPLSERARPTREGE